MLAQEHLSPHPPKLAKQRVRSSVFQLNTGDGTSWLHLGPSGYYSHANITLTHSCIAPVDVTFTCYTNENKTQVSSAGSTFIYQGEQVHLAINLTVSEAMADGIYIEARRSVEDMSCKMPFKVQYTTADAEKTQAPPAEVANKTVAQRHPTPPPTTPLPRVGTLPQGPTMSMAVLALLCVLCFVMKRKETPAKKKLDPTEPSDDEV